MLNINYDKELHTQACNLIALQLFGGNIDTGDNILKIVNDVTEAVAAVY